MITFLKMGSLPKPKTKKKNLPKSVSEMSSEMLQETLKKKKECNTKALEIVEKLCETDVEEEWFLENLQYINQSHFDDATVERAIMKQCGYPLCNEKLEKIRTQQYHISTRYNKVFDISERKHFCSSSCYKAAIYIKNQLFTSPLWFRDQEVIPKYKILKSSKSSLGEEVVFFPDKIKPEVDDVGKNKREDGIKKLEEQCEKLHLSDDSNIKETENLKSEKKEVKNDIIVEVVERRSQERVEEVKKINKQKETTESTKPKPINPVTKVENSVFEWFTLDTLFFLYKEEKIKELFSDEASRLKEVLNSKLKMASHNDKIDRMIQLYGLFDAESFNKIDKAPLKPLPDYSALKEEGKNLEIKVKAFYQGQLEMKPKEKEESKKEEEKKEDSGERGEEGGGGVYLPLVDAHAQVALRRKIVLDKLNRVLPELMRIFDSDFVLQMAEVRNLVSTFLLTATNITFRPNEWNLVGIILLKLLSVKDTQLKSILCTESSRNQLQLILMTYEVLNKNYLDDFIRRIIDSKNIMNKIGEINR